MDVAMEYCLPRTFPDVNADVEAVWMELSLQNVTTFPAKFPDLLMFFYFKVEETCHMTFGND